MIINGMQSQVLFGKDAIASRVKQIASQINQDFHGQSLVIVGVLKGSFIFLADLLREIDLDVQTTFIQVKSYEGTASTGNIEIIQDIDADISDKEVLLVEDIVDTGLTVAAMLKHFTEKKPRSLKICSLLHKPDSQLNEIPIDYVGFSISKEFVIGYGLDLDGKFRQFPNILQLKSEVS